MGFVANNLLVANNNYTNFMSINRNINYFFTAQIPLIFLKIIAN